MRTCRARAGGRVQDELGHEDWPKSMEKNCVIIPTHPLHYAEAHANLLSMLRFATDAVLPRVFIVLDREADRHRLRGGQFPPDCEAIGSAEACAALASFVHTLSLEGLLEARGEGLRTQPHINATLNAAFDAWHAGCLKARDAAVCDHASWRLDFFKPVPHAWWLGHGGHPRVAVPPCHGADFLSWKRKYQAIKKLSLTLTLTLALTLTLTLTLTVTVTLTLALALALSTRRSRSCTPRRRRRRRMGASCCG